MSVANLSHGDRLKMYVGLSVKECYFCLIFNPKSNVSGKFFEPKILNFTTISPAGVTLSCTDGEHDVDNSRGSELFREST